MNLNYETPDITINTGTTYRARFDALYAQIDKSKLTFKSKMVLVYSANYFDVYSYYGYNDAGIRFGFKLASETNIIGYNAVLKASNSLWVRDTITNTNSVSFQDLSLNTANVLEIRFYY